MKACVGRFYDEYIDISLSIKFNSIAFLSRLSPVAEAVILEVMRRNFNVFNTLNREQVKNCVCLSQKTHFMMLLFNHC